MESNLSLERDVETAWYEEIKRCLTEVDAGTVRVRFRAVIVGGLVGNAVVLLLDDDFAAESKSYTDAQ
jgi:hypothetical protein